MADERLIDPVWIAVEVAEPSAQLMNRNAKTPVKGRIGTRTVLLEAQIVWENQAEQTVRPGGVTEDNAGYVVVRNSDMVSSGGMLKRGDRIATIGNTSGLALYVTGRRPFFHSSEIGGPIYSQVFFADRDPTRE